MAGDMKAALQAALDPFRTKLLSDIATEYGVNLEELQVKMAEKGLQEAINTVKLKPGDVGVFSEGATKHTSFTIDGKKFTLVYKYVETDKGNNAYGKVVDEDGNMFTDLKAFGETYGIRFSITRNEDLACVNIINDGSRYKIETSDDNTVVNSKI